MGVITSQKENFNIHIVPNDMTYLDNNVTSNLQEDDIVVNEGYTDVLKKFLKYPYAGNLVVGQMAKNNNIYSFGDSLYLKTSGDHIFSAAGDIALDSYQKIKPITEIGSGGGTQGNFLRKDASDTMNGNLTVRGIITATEDIMLTSDKRLKTNIKVIQNPIDKIKQLNGYTFAINNKNSVGVIAQEVEKVFPELVYEMDGYKRVAYQNLIGLLIEVNKDLINRIERLENGNEY